MSCSIRSLTHADYDAADTLLRAAFGSEVSYRPRLERYCAIDPAGWFVADDGGELLGTVGAFDYGGFGYLGLMAVHPRAQRQRIGRMLLDHVLAWLEARGVDCALLEATVHGAPLYRKAGFTGAEPTHELIAGPEARVPIPPSDHLEPTIAPVAQGELAGVVALDHTFFGADRTRMWHRLDAEKATILASHAPDGAITGYLCIQPKHFGPWGARSEAAARRLLAAALASTPAPTPFRVMVPHDSAAAHALLTASGFTLLRTVHHMRRGALATPLSWHELYGKASFCLG